MVPRASVGGGLIRGPRRRRSDRRTHRGWGWIRVSLLRFSQDSISASLQDGRSLARVVCDLITGQCRVHALCPLNIVRFRGLWFSRDNRRLYILRKVLRPSQRVRVRFGQVDELFLAHFSTEDEGCTVRVRRCRKRTREAAAPRAARPGACRRLLRKIDGDAFQAAATCGQTLLQWLLRSENAAHSPHGRTVHHVGFCKRLLLSIAAKEGGPTRAARTLLDPRH